MTKFKQILDKAVAGLCVHSPDKLSLVLFAPDTSYATPAEAIVDTILALTNGDRDWATNIANVAFRNAYILDDEQTIAATGLALARLARTPWLTAFVPHESKAHLTEHLPTCLFMSRAEFDHKVLVDWKIPPNAPAHLGDVIMTVNTVTAKAA